MGESRETQALLKRPFPLKRGLLIAGVLLLIFGAGVALLFSSLVSRIETRQNLNELLGSQPQETIPDSFPQANDPSNIHPPNLNPEDLLNKMQREMDGMNGGIQDKINSLRASTPEIDIQETGNAYEVRIALPRQEDEKYVRVEANSNHIGISGKFSLVAADGKTVNGSTSFMKYFTTSTTLQPDRVTRKLMGNTLVITIPKKQGEENQEGPASFSPPKTSRVTPPVSAEELEESLPPPDTSI